MVAIDLDFHQGGDVYGNTQADFKELVVTR